MQPMTARSRTLDILRAAAIFLVLGRHLTICPEDVSPFLHAVTRTWERGGWTGVDLFFVLSGFLIASLLFNEQQRHGAISFRKFFVRRGLKIYPPFLVMIAATAIVGELRGEPVLLRSLARELVFLQNYGRGLWSHTWSLAVEEHFYLLLPLALIASRSATFGWVPRAFVAVACACLALRVATAVRLPYRPETHLYPTHLRVDALFWGVALAYAYHYRQEWFRSVSERFRPLLITLGIACFVPPFLVPLGSRPVAEALWLTMLSAGGAMLLVALVPVEPRGTAPVRALAYAGSHSYSIYLWHIPVAAWIARPFANWYVYAAVYFAASLVLGILMAAAVEMPVLRLRDRFFPSRSRALPRP